MMTTGTAVGASAVRRSRRAVPVLVAALACILPATSGGTRAQSAYPFKPAPPTRICRLLLPGSARSRRHAQHRAPLGILSLLHVYGAVPGESSMSPSREAREAKGEHETLCLTHIRDRQTTPPRSSLRRDERTPHRVG